MANILRPAPQGIFDCGRNNDRATFLKVRRLPRDPDTLRFTVGLWDVPSRRWRVELTVTDAGASQTVPFHGRTDRNGRLAWSVDRRGLDDPRVRAVATGMQGLRCRMAINPPNRL